MNDLDLALMLNPNDEHLKEEIKKFRSLMGKLLEKIQNSYSRDDHNDSADEISQDSDEEVNTRSKPELIKRVEKKIPTKNGNSILIQEKAKE